MYTGPSTLQPAQSLEQTILETAKRLGFSLVGWVDAAPARRLNAYFDWIAAGMHGEMGYLARPDRQARRKDLNVILPGVKTIICVGLDYYSRQLPADIANDPNRGRISNYAWGVDYHDLITPRLEELAAEIKKHPTFTADSGSELNHKVYVDTGAILERDHAESAGFGFTGKNTMLIHPRRGSWFFLGEILLNIPLAPLPIKQPNESLAVDYLNSQAAVPSCGSCRRCLEACPTRAFPQPYVLDARRCISYLTIELKGSIPRDLRPLIQNWIYGCDVCQEVCPFNRFAQLSPEPRFYTDKIENAAPKLSDMLDLNQEQFNIAFANSPIKRIKWHRFIRNVAVAVGNSGNRDLLPKLTHMLHNEENNLIREHVAWAIGRLGGKEILASALSNEIVENVQKEIQLTLQSE